MPQAEHPVGRLCFESRVLGWGGRRARRELKVCSFAGWQTRQVVTPELFETQRNSFKHSAERMRPEPANLMPAMRSEL